MTHTDFVKERLVAMEKAPGMWASSNETFGMQLVLLVEFYQLQKPDMYKTELRSVMAKLFGPGPGLHVAPLEDDWARAGVATIRLILGIG